MVAHPFRTLRGRLATTYACLALLGVAGSALYTASLLRTGLRERVTSDLADEARLIGAAVAEPLSRGDYTSAAEIAERGQSLTRARFVVVDARGTPLGASAQARQADEGSPPDLFGAADVVRLSVPIEHGGETVGTIVAASSIDELHSMFGRLNATTVLV
ncbi:MAG: hypothetical protein M3336_06300, partial [Chloroflexota bacterium]|nr:hypothetical protein [Chloroflexota bacterium]